MIDLEQEYKKNVSELFKHLEAMQILIMKQDEIIKELSNGKIDSGYFFNA